MLSVTKQRIWIIPIVGLSAGIVGWLVFLGSVPHLTPRGEESSQHGGAGSANRRDSHDATKSPSKHSDPSLPWAELETLAQREGISKARPRFRAAVQSEQQLHAGAPVLGWTNTWARMEARAIYRGARVPDHFENQVWRPIFDAVKNVYQQNTRLLNAHRSNEKKLTSRVDSKTGKTTTDPKRLRQYRARLRTLETTGYEADRSFLLLAELAKIASRPDLVREVFQAHPERFFIWKALPANSWEVGEDMCTHRLFVAGEVLNRPRHPVIDPV